MDTTNTASAEQMLEALRARLPENDRGTFDEMVRDGCPIDLLAEEVKRYLGMRRFWADVPPEAKDGLDRMLAAGRELEGLPDEEAARLMREHLMVMRAADFTETRHRRFRMETHTARARMRPHTPVSSTPGARNQQRDRERRPRARTAAGRAAGARAGQDPGESEGEQEPPPPPRLCAFCNRELPPEKRKYCTDRHADRDPQRRKRERDRQREAWAEHERALENLLHWVMDGEALTTPEERAGSIGAVAA
jgi:hypothetical protein